MAAFPEHASVFAQLPGRLDRDAVRDVASYAADSPDRAIEAFVVTLTWGFGSVGYGPFRARRILASTPRPGELLQGVARTLIQDGPLAAYGRFAGDSRLKYLGPAFGTKYLAFCQPADQRPKALIHDELVSSWLARHGRPDLASASWSKRTYCAYLDQADAWATAMGCDPEVVEYLIFQAMAAEQGNQWSE